MCCGKGGALQANITGVCGEDSQCSGRTGFALARGMCSFPVYTVQAPGCSRGGGSCVPCGSSFRVLRKSADSVGPAFCASPGLSSSGSQELHEHTLPRCGAPSPLCGPSLSFQARLSGTPCVSSGELVSSCRPPSGCQPSRISGSLWLETGNLFQFGRGCCLWGRVCPFPLPTASCLRQGMGRSVG